MHSSVEITERGGCDPILWHTFNSKAFILAPSSWSLWNPNSELQVEDRQHRRFRVTWGRRGWWGQLLFQTARRKFINCKKRSEFNYSHNKASNLSIPTKLSFSCAVSFGKSSSISVAFPDAIFSSSLPATPRLRAAAEAAAVSDTPHDFMEKNWEDQRHRATPPKCSYNESVAQLSRIKTGRSVILAKSSRKWSLQIIFHTPHCTPNTTCIPVPIYAWSWCNVGF